MNCHFLSTVILFLFISFSFSFKHHNWEMAPSRRSETIQLDKMTKVQLEIQLTRVEKEVLVTLAV